MFQELHSTIEDTYVASVDTGRGQRDILRIYDTAGLQGTVQVFSKHQNVDFRFKFESDTFRIFVATTTLPPVPGWICARL